VVGSRYGGSRLAQRGLREQHGRQPTASSMKARRSRGFRPVERHAAAPAFRIASRPTTSSMPRSRQIADALVGREPYAVRSMREAARARVQLRS
jgi:hypothetical protein